MYDAFEDFASYESYTAKPGYIKRKAASYLGIQIGQPLTRQELKQVNAKSHKIKDSKKKADRHWNHQLLRYLD